MAQNSVRSRTAGRIKRLFFCPLWLEGGRVKGEKKGEKEKEEGGNYERFEDSG